MGDPESSTVAVVGGGLVGSLLAILLVRRGLPVTVFERRSDPRVDDSIGGRSINLVLTRRGLRALDRVGLAERALAMTVPVVGRMMHARDGGTAFQPYGRDRSECNYSISRGELNRFLIEEAERRGARFRFGMTLERARLDTGLLEFAADGCDERQRIRADVVFGADGAGSALRHAFDQVAGFSESTDWLSHGYKELYIPPGDDGPRLQLEALHIWPRGSRMLMALANLDRSFTGTLYLPWQGGEAFDALSEPRHVEALFREEFPDAIPLFDDLAGTYFGNPSGRLGTVRCGPWHLGGKALLIGDAAHAIVPFFGQGMNAGFEDCRVLDDLLDRHGIDAWDTVLPELSRTRKPDTDAIADMAIDNFVEMSERVGDRAFLLRKQVEHRLEEAMPLEYRSRYSMVMYSHVPFRLCLQAGEIQRELLDELCRDLPEVDRLDLERAGRLVRERLTPFLGEQGVSLDY